ncbi:MAG TPA: ATP-binding protein [Pirellulales bacterium]|jgi:anti-sigma regulatory factor (Ser/Thr protein kinase)|nr:ATP-binding protein [Pirellulales bacterium]
MPACHTVVEVKDASHVGEARRIAARIAAETSLGEADRGRVAIVATEMANNLHRHAVGGKVLLRPMRGPDSNRSDVGVELLAIDRGPGMPNVARCFEDGYSTGGTAGTGLGAIRRLATESDVYSAQPSGTVIMARIFAAGTHPSEDPIRYGAICVAAPGETACGDNWSFIARDATATFMIADGLGHGVLAAEASAEAVRVFEAKPLQRPAAFLQAAHQPLRTTRGAAVAAALINIAERKLYYSGFGNVCGSIFDNRGADGRGLVSHNGTLGLQIRAVHDIEYDWPHCGLLVMHSDGLQTRWNLAAYPGLAQRHPAVIAAILFRDFTRGRDDVTVAVLR